MIFFMAPIQDNPDGKDSKRILLFYIIMSAITIMPAIIFTKTSVCGTLSEQINLPFIIDLSGIFFWLMQALAFMLLIIYIINKIISLKGK